METKYEHVADWRKEQSIGRRGSRARKIEDIVVWSITTTLGRNITIIANPRVPNYTLQAAFTQIEICGYTLVVKSIKRKHRHMKQKVQGSNLVP